MNRFLLEKGGQGTATPNQHVRKTEHEPSPSTQSPRPGWQGRVSGFERRLLRRLLTAVGSPPLTMVLWNGEQFAPPSGTAAVARVLIHDRRTLWKLALDPLFQFGEAYATGRVEVEGNLAETLTVIFGLLNARRVSGRVESLLLRWLHKPKRNTLGFSRENIHHHYDIGNDFYRLWLDEQLVYTCAYFAERSMTLEQAQFAKMDHVCRKLQLQPGQKVLEAGCGWGALALHMAQHYGVQVKAFNISHEQIVYARQLARQEGLEDQVEFVEDDWRTICEPCDIFVSVGMLEHVGVQNYRRLGDVIRRCLRQDGRALIHTIGQNYVRPMNSWIERRIFPGAYPPTLREINTIFEPYDFSILDVENLRLHYAETLRHWLSRYEQSIDTVGDMFDEQFIRMWRLYLSGSIAAFESGSLQLFQVVFAHGSNNQVPWTRAHLYADHASENRVRPRPR